LDKLIITVAVCGAEVTKQDNPNLPTTPEEIAQDVYNCFLKGASIVHLHVRDKDGKPTQDIEVFKKTMELIRSQCDIIIQISTGGALSATPEERAAPLALIPEMASLTCGTVNFGSGVFWNPPDLIESFARRMKELKIKPEIEVFEAGMINNALQLVKKGLLQLPLHFDFVMGVPGGITGNIRDLVYLVESIPSGSTWSVAGIGRFELPLAVAAIIMGGHVRVGFEDNIYYSKGVLAQSNAQLVERVVRIARELGREIASPEEARRILNLYA
jgi:3-keto-5-aminohexanoate cleavage enzyme